jgi:hypothetical protein
MGRFASRLPLMGNTSVYAVPFIGLLITLEFKYELLDQEEVEVL